MKMNLLRGRHVLPPGSRRWLVVPVAIVGLLAAPMGLLAGPALAGPVALTNGSFENTNNTYVDCGCYGGGFETLDPAPSSTATAIPGWTVTSGSVDWISYYWSAEDGSYSLDMNGTATTDNPDTAGSIQQTFATVTGGTYMVQFWLAGNPDGGPAVKTLYVQATGGPSKPYSFDTATGYNGGPTSNTHMGWVQEGYSFTATSTSTTLTFSADPSNMTNNGPALDNVTVTGILTSGAQCKDDGWQGQKDPATGLPFNNQGQCVSYFATNGDTPIGS